MSSLKCVLGVNILKVSEILIPRQVSFSCLQPKNCFKYCLHSSSSELLTKMSSPKRYFINELPDYSPDRELSVSKDSIKANIMLLISEIESKQPPSVKFGDGGLYVGIAGIAYMFYYLSKSPVFNFRRDDFISKGLEYINQAEKYQLKKPIRDPSDSTGFLLGGSGVHAVAACLYQCAG